eukprot:6883657-Prymnesium_polylepis.1
MVAGVYFCTYSTANLIDTLCERLLDPKAASTPQLHNGTKVVGTTAANMSASIAKDVAFAKCDAHHRRGASTASSKGGAAPPHGAWHRRAGAAALAPPR